MRVDIQYSSDPNTRPTDMKISDVGFTVASGEPIPNVGDYIQVPICLPEDEKGRLREFKVIYRNFFYYDNQQESRVILVVTDSDEPVQNNYRE